MANISGVVSTHPEGGQNVSVNASHGLGNDVSNVSAGVFAAGNTLKGPVTTGAFAAANVNGHGLSVQHTKTPNFGSTLSESAHINVFKNETHAINATAMHSRSQLDSGLKFDKISGNVGWQHEQGHAASMGVSRIPQFNMNQIEAAGKANLWSSPNRATTLDLTGSASKHVSGPFVGNKNFGAGMGVTHRF